MEVKNEAVFGGATPIQTYGSRRQVKIYKSALKTNGGLTEKDLVVNKHGRIVSKKKHDAGDKALLNLTKKGWYTKKGTFGSKKLTGKALKKRKAYEGKTRKNKGKKANRVKGGMSSFNAEKVPLLGGDDQEEGNVEVTE